MRHIRLRVLLLPLVLLCLSACGDSAAEEREKKRLYINVEHENGEWGSVQVKVSTDPGTALECAGIEATADGEGKAVLVVPFSKLSKEIQQDLRVSGKHGERSNAITFTITRPFTPYPRITPVEGEGTIAQAQAYQDYSKWVVFHFDRDIRTQATVEWLPNATLTFNGVEVTADADGKATVTLDLSRAFWAKTLFEASRAPIERGGIPVNYTATAPDGGKVEGMFRIEPKGLLKGVLALAKQGGLAVPEGVDTDGPPGAVLYWGADGRYTSHQVFPEEARVSTVRFIAYGTETERKTRCGPYRHIETGASEYREMELHDATIELYDRATGELVTSKSFRAKGKCPRGLTEEEGIWHSVRVDKTYRPWLKSQLRRR